MFYDDGVEVRIKDVKIVSVDDFFVCFENLHNGKVEYINKDKVIRFEPEADNG